jgi:hypothetical protein
MSEDELLSLIHATRRELDELRRSQRRWRTAALGLVVMAMALPASSWATRRFGSALVVQDAEQSATLAADGLSFAIDGNERLKIASTPGWVGVTGYGEEGAVAWTVGTDRGVTSFKLFSGTQALRVELTEQLLGAGAGMRLYDREGKPRATLWADKRGESGMALTDTDFQPRIELRAEPDGSSFIRAVDSNAENMAELSVIRSSDVLSRYTGGFPMSQDPDPLAPMIYLSDRSGQRHLATPNPPF